MKPLSTPKSQFGEQLRSLAATEREPGNAYIRVSIERIAKNIEELNIAIETLHDKLHPILVDAQTDAGEANPAMPYPVQSTMAKVIGDHADKFDTAINRIRNIITQIDL